MTSTTGDLELKHQVFNTIAWSGDATEFTDHHAHRLETREALGRSMQPCNIL